MVDILGGILLTHQLRRFSCRLEVQKDLNLLNEQLLFIRELLLVRNLDDQLVK